MSFLKHILQSINVGMVVSFALYICIGAKCLFGNQLLYN